MFAFINIKCLSTDMAEDWNSIKYFENEYDENYTFAKTVMLITTIGEINCFI